MSEIQDPLNTILEGLKAPIEAVKPTEYDHAAIHRYLMARYDSPTLKDALNIETPTENE